MFSLIKFVLFTLIICFSSNAYAIEKSLFWKIESPNGVTSYLFGTINSDDVRISNFSPNVINAIKQVDAVMLDHSNNTDPRSSMIRDFNIEEKLTKEEFDKVRLLADYHEMYLENIVRTKPLILASLFLYTSPISSLNQSYLLHQKFAEMRKKIEYIESHKEYYARMVDILNIEDQLIILRNTLTFTQAEKEKRYQQLIRAYLNDDLDAVNITLSNTNSRLMPTSLRERYKKYRHAHFALIAERSIAAATEKSLFFVISADDLVGDDSFIVEFKKAGFTASSISKQ